MKMSARLIVVLLGGWVLWQGVSSSGQVSWRHRRTFAEPPPAGFTAERWCEAVRESLAGHGTFLCLPEGAVPGDTTRPRLREPRP
jgi:hypothetical protein